MVLARLFRANVFRLRASLSPVGRLPVTRRRAEGDLQGKDGPEGPAGRQHQAGVRRRQPPGPAIAVVERRQAASNAPETPVGAISGAKSIPFAGPERSRPSLIMCIIGMLFGG